MLEFLAPTHNGVATQTRHLDQTLDAATPPLYGEQADTAPPISFVQGRQRAIERAMLFSRRAVGMLLTDCTRANMKR